MNDLAGTPSSRIDFGRVAEDYETTRGIPDAFMNELIEDIIRTCDLKSNNLVLEVGCGVGRFLRALSRQKISVVGVDISQKMLQKAYSNQRSMNSFRLNLVLGDAARIPLNQGLFNVILAIHLFHLMADWHEAVAEMIHGLKSGGIIITGYVSAVTYQSFLNQLYRQRRNELGYAAPTLGAELSEVVAEFKTRGATIETHNFQTFVDVPLRVTLSYLERRVFSSMWHNLPDVVHRQIMQDVHAAATTKFKTLEDIEHIPIDAQLHFVGFE